MLPKINRLPLQKKYKPPSSNRKTYHTPLFTAIVCKKNSTKPPRFGFIVSKKIDNRSTTRNYLKRKLREAAWLALKKRNFSADILFIVKKEALKYPVIKIKDIIEKILIESTGS